MLSSLILRDMSYKITSPSCHRVRSRQNWMDSVSIYSIYTLASLWDMLMSMWIVNFGQANRMDFFKSCFTPQPLADC